MKIHFNKIVVVFMMTIIFLIDGCNNISNKSHNSFEQSIPEYSYYLLQFFDGNDKVLLCYMNNKIKSKTMFIYEIQSHKLYKPLIMNNEDYPRFPKFSRDEKQVVFVSDKDGGRNIYMMKADGSGVRQLTFSKGNSRTDSEGYYDVETNEGPSFSPDGKFIIFKRARTLRVKKYYLGGYSVGPIWWDVFEIEIATGQERRLTSIDSHLMSDPFYLSDGKRFIFQGSKRIEDEGIYIASNEGGSLNKISAGGWWIPGPRISCNDKIVFMGGKHLQHPEHDLFIYENGERKKLNWIQRGSYVTNIAISPDGSRVLFEIAKYKDHYMIEQSLWIGKADGTELQEIKIPWEHLKDSNVN